MNFKVFAAIAALFFITDLSAQEDLTSSSLNIKNDIDLFPIVDDAMNSHLFFVANRKITHIKYDAKYNEKFNRVLDLGTDFSTRKKSILGYHLRENGNIDLYFSNNKRNKFYLITINPDGTLIIKNFDFKIKKEKFLKAFNLNNKFYALTVVKNSSDLRVYSFTEDQFSVSDYSFKTTKFLTDDNIIVYLHRLLSAQQPALELVENDVPNSLEIASKTNKLYIADDKLLITLDHRDSNTQLLELDLKNGETTSTNYDIPVFKFKPASFYSSNSYLYENRLYQLLSNNKKMVLSIKNLGDDTAIKEIEVNKEDDLSFSNTPIIQEGGQLESYRELEKTRQFLRKVSNSKRGIAAYRLENELQLTIGGVKKIATGGMPMMMPGFGLPIGAIGAMTISVNPVFFTYGSYTRTKSTYINSLFDNEELTHIEGEVTPNVFERIGAYAEEIKPKYETVYKHGNDFVFGHYNRYKKLFSLIKFKE